jgi:hypothetical protein
VLLEGCADLGSWSVDAHMDRSTLEPSETNNSGPVKPGQPHRLRRCSTFVAAGLILACILFAGLSALSNFLLPAQIPATGRLSDLDKARLAEAFHLRGELGDTLWQGWGQDDIPMILYNEDYAFLVGYPDPPSGWVKVPGNETRGGPWEEVPDDSFEGQPYYRQPLAPDITPQAFVVLIGARWVSSLPSREWMQIQLGNDFKESVPPFLRPFFPYRLAARLFLSAAGGADLYICGILHESFHAYEGIHAQGRISSAEDLFNQNQNRYPWESEALVRDWQVELNLLADATQAKSDGEAAELARQFLDQRQKRRATADLDADLINLERQKEWEEGLAKYTELSIWRLAAKTASYHPLPVMAGDPGFQNYANIDPRWSQEIEQIRRMANDQGDTRFYYSGLAQAALLDRLAPDWKTKIMNENVFLEDLLRDAVE